MIRKEDSRDEMYSHHEEMHLSIEIIQEGNINAETYRNIRKIRYGN